MHILFLSHYFPPEVNAPASRTFEHCVRWVRAGHQVTVVTCVPNCPEGVVYEGYRNRWRRQVEFVEGVRVVRVWTYLAPNAGTVRRIANYLSYMASAVAASLRLGRPDVVVATSPQFFCGWAGVLVSRLKRSPFVLEIRDIWPESIEAVGAMRSRPLLRLLERLERGMYRAADQIVTVGEGYRGKIAEKLGGEVGGAEWRRGGGAEDGRWSSEIGADGEVASCKLGEEVGVGDPLTSAPPPLRPSAPRISVITNGVDLEQFVPGEADARFLHRWGLEGGFVCSYVGTIGMAHGLEVVIEAARRLRAKGRGDIRFCLVGDGASRARLEAEALEAGVADLVVFTGRQPREEVPRILASSDACLIHLKKCELFGTVIPSKVFETMAMGRPIIMGVEGESRQIVMEAEAGLEMSPGDAGSLVEAVETLADTPELAGQLGKAAREYVGTWFARDVLAERYLRLLHEVAGVVEAGVEETARAAAAAAVEVGAIEG